MWLIDFAISRDIKHRREAAWRRYAAERADELREREVRALEQIAENGKRASEDAR